MESWLVDKYINSPLPVPGTLLQGVLNLYIDAFNRVGALWHDQQVTYPPAEELAAHSRELMETHYDQPRELFEGLLGGVMKYSMGLWECGARTLEESQREMLADVCEKARIEDGQVILDIGCGFGSFVEYALQRFPHSKVYGLSLSKVQCDYMRQKQSTPGHPLHTERFCLIEGDFNTVRLEPQFDRIVSIGMFEHVTNLTLALKSIRALIAPEGLSLLHYIVYGDPIAHVPPRAPERNFIQRYIFPGGRVWYWRDLYLYQQDMRVEQFWFLNGSNYRRTLEAWLANLLHNRERLCATGRLDKRTLRIWELYLRVCISIFHAGRGEFFGNGQYLLRSTRQDPGPG